MIQYCSCGGAMMHTSYSIVCTTCGIECPTLSTKIQSYTSSPQARIVIAPYCRKHRFSCLLRQILGVSSGPPPTDRVWQLLSQSAPFKTTQEIINCLKNTCLKSKHYNNLHIFSKAFLNDYLPPVLHNTEPLIIEKSLETLFDEVLFRWNRFQSHLSFFSYAWLIEKLLKHVCLFETYRTYLKVLICPNRRRKYQSRWEEITKLPLTDSQPFQNDRQLISLDAV